MIREGGASYFLTQLEILGSCDLDAKDNLDGMPNMRRVLSYNLKSFASVVVCFPDRGCIIVGGVNPSWG